MYFSRSKGNGREIHFKKEKQNKLSLITEYFGTIHGIFDIPPEAFHPKPKVTSTLIRLVKNNEDRG